MSNYQESQIMLYLYFFLLNGLSTLQKVSGSCYDELTKEPVPFVTITVASIVTDTDGNGYFEIETGDTDSISFSCTGYNPVKMAIAELEKTDSVFLARNSLILPEIKVNISKTSYQLGLLKYKGRFDFVSEAAVRFELATKFEIPPHTDSYWIKKILLRGYGFNSHNPVRIHIYDVDPSGEPGIDLLNKDIILAEDRSKKGILEINIEDQNLVLEERSFFLSVQWIADSLNQDLISKKATDKPLGPHVYGTYEKRGMISYTRQKGLEFKWRFMGENFYLPHMPTKNKGKTYSLLATCEIIPL